MMNDENAKQMIKKNLAEAKINSMLAGNSNVSPRNKNPIPLDLIMNRVLNKHINSNTNLVVEEKTDESFHRNRRSIHSKSPRGSSII